MSAFVLRDAQAFCDKRDIDPEFKETTDADIEKLQAAAQAGLMPMPPVPGHAHDQEDPALKPPKTGLLEKPTIELLPEYRTWCIDSQAAREHLAIEYRQSLFYRLILSIGSLRSF